MKRVGKVKVCFRSRGDIVCFALVCVYMIVQLQARDWWLIGKVLTNISSSSSLAHEAPLPVTHVKAAESHTAVQ